MKIYEDKGFADNIPYHAYISTYKAYDDFVDATFKLFTYSGEVSLEAEEVELLIPLMAKFLEAHKAYKLLKEKSDES